MKLHTHFLFLSSGLAIALAALVAIGSWIVLEKQLEGALAERMKKESALVAESLPRPFEPANARLWTVARDASIRLGIRVTVIDPAGVVVAESERSPDAVREIENQIGQPEIQQALAGGLGQARRHSATVGVDFLYVARRIDVGGRPIGYLRLAEPARALVETDRYYRWLLATMLAGGLAASVLLSVWLARRLGRPVEDIRRAALEIASGAYGRGIDEDRSDEIGDLARSISKMRNQLVSSLERTDRERSLLDSILEAIQEGVLLVDEDFRVSFANLRLRRLFGVSGHPKDRSLSEWTRVPEVLDAFRDALEKGETTSRTLRLEVANRPVALELRVVPVEEPARPGRRAAVGLFLDMTALEAVESMRRRFVGDVSHELRTPLTAIKAAAETLTSSGKVPEPLRRFPEIVFEQSLRMEALVDDLTDLSLIESGAVSLEIEPIPLAELVAGIFKDLEHKAVTSGVVLRSEIPSGLALDADRRRIGQVLVNLIDNAIKFSTSNYDVVVRAGDGDAGTWVEVTDRGLGIAPGEHDRIFQRFYQSDRSRSKKRPGTGLGLAIVKHLMILHGGKVTVGSEPGKGSTFRLELPRGGTATDRST